jgi:hypothetical protein
VDVHSLITHRFSLKRAAEAFALLEELKQRVCEANLKSGVPYEGMGSQ